MKFVVWRKFIVYIGYVKDNVVRKFVFFCVNLVLFWRLSFLNWSDDFFKLIKFMIIDMWMVWDYDVFFLNCFFILIVI